MFKNMKKQLKNEKGLTLIELLAVIVILAIVAAIAIPAIGNIIQNSSQKAVIADAQNVLAAGNLYFLENPDKDTVYSKGETENLIPDFLDDAPTLTNVTVKKVASGNTITFTGTAGKIVKTFENKTKVELNNKAIYDEFDAE